MLFERPLLLILDGLEGMKLASVIWIGVRFIEGAIVMVDCCCGSQKWDLLKCAWKATCFWRIMKRNQSIHSRVLHLLLHLLQITTTTNYNYYYNYNYNTITTTLHYNNYNCYNNYNFNKLNYNRPSYAPPVGHSPAFGPAVKPRRYQI